MAWIARRFGIVNLPRSFSFLNPVSKRVFSSTPKEKPVAPETEEPEVKSSTMNWKVVVASVLVGGAGLLFFQYESEKARSRQRATQNKSMGKPLVGGPFHLVDTKGNPVSDRNFRGKYMLIYFGFAHCPDICPRELSKMTDVMNVMDAVLGPIVQPIMISVDPGRDTPEALEEYRKKYHKRLLALSGSVENVTSVAKTFRIYVSAIPADEKDYLVDHSICFYLMDTNGEILEYFGQHYTADEVIVKMKEIVQNDQKELQTGVKIQKP